MVSLIKSLSHFMAGPKHHIKFFIARVMLILKTGSSCEHVWFQLRSFLWLLISRKSLSALFCLFFYTPTAKVLIFFLKICSTTTTLSALKCHKLQNLFSKNEPQFLPTVPELVVQEEQSDFSAHRTLGFFGQLFVPRVFSSHVGRCYTLIS